MKKGYIYISDTEPNSSQVLPYKDDFMSLLVLLHAKTLSKRGFTFTGRVVSSLLLMATNTYPLDDMNRYVNDDEWKSPSKCNISVPQSLSSCREGFSTNHHKTWGRLYSADEVQVCLALSLIVPSRETKAAYVGAMAHTFSR